VNIITIPLAIYVGKSVLDAAYISYAIRAIGAIVIIFGIYKKNWITETGVIYAFIGGTLTIFACVFGKSFGWFSVDKTYGAVVSAIVFIIIGNFVENKKKNKKLINRI
ncbi:MAG: hypothetical protein JXR69_06630, partial [Candidatus Delongbacteria bacterium]|nr:hypothetical protein [Candidatus Delongbacteria bacterium]